MAPATTFSTVSRWLATLPPISWIRPRQPPPPKPLILILGADYIGQHFIYWLSRLHSSAVESRILNIGFCIDSLETRRYRFVSINTWLQGDSIHKDANLRLVRPYLHEAVAMVACLERVPAYVLQELGSDFRSYAAEKPANAPVLVLKSSCTGSDGDGNDVGFDQIAEVFDFRASRTVYVSI